MSEKTNVNDIANDNMPEVLPPEENSNPAPRKASSIPPETVPGFSSKDSWDLMAVQAATLSRSSIIPTEFRNKPENCIIALNMANRLGADPLMVMQNLYIVSGKPGWSSQFLISTFNTCGRFTALRYEFSGEAGSDDYGCLAYSTEKESGEVLKGSMVTIGIAKAEGWYTKNGSKWPNMPQQMLMYRAASWFVRAYAPEISMGLQTVEELNDTTDMTPNAAGVYEAVETPQGTGNEKLRNAMSESGALDFDR